MRIRLNVPPGEDTLLYVSKLPEPEKSAAEETVLAIENRALEEMRLQPGLPELLQFLAHHKIPRAILTRNNRQSVDHMLQQVMTPHHNGQPQVFSFHPIVTRDFQPVKPEPAPLYHIAACWGVRPEELIMVGDHRDDLECGRRAGAVAVLLKDKVNAHFIPLADICLESLDQLIPYLQKGFTLSEVTASN
ncbi:hypothetical protein IWQ61_000234 [Dispira simplex]|nr:hypothetical protein IWQ61_000234 [Dispira simplex]